MDDLFNPLSWDSQIISEKLEHAEPPTRNINDQLENIILKQELIKSKKDLDSLKRLSENAHIKGVTDHQQNNKTEGFSGYVKDIPYIPKREGFQSGPINTKRESFHGNLGYSGYCPYEHYQTPTLFGFCIKKLLLIIIIVFIAIYVIQHQSYKQDLKNIMDLVKNKPIETPALTA
jgi:hypothetical protein